MPGGRVEAHLDGASGGSEEGWGPEERRRRRIVSQRELWMEDRLAKGGGEGGVNASGLVGSGRPNSNEKVSYKYLYLHLYTPVLNLYGVHTSNERQDEAQG